jgi:Flp pilus assembly protein TadG
MLASLQLLSDRLRRFGQARDGNVAVMFAIATIPIIGAVGAAIDYSHANSVKTAMQEALDSTALMVSRDAATLTSAQLQSKADSYFKALFTRPEAIDLKVTATYSTDGGSQVMIGAVADVPTSIMNIMGYDKIPIASSTTVKWGTNRLRVALVLDNTGSMASSGKMSALKTATNNLLTQLKNAATTNGDVYVSIVPFVKDVNVDPSNYTANWIYWGTKAQDPSLTDNTSWDALNGSCSRGSSFGDRASCLAAPICSKSQYTTKNKCNNNGGTWYASAGTWTVKNHNTWNGCVMDRGYPTSPSNLSGKSGPDTTNNYDTNVGGTDVNKPSSLYAAEQYSYCPSAAIMPLSYNWSSMTTLVNNMSPNGNTNQAIGLQLGWMSLVGGGPFPTPPTETSGYNYSHIIILLTDGLNTEDRWYTDQASIDARQKLTCDAAKAAGITLYMIQVNTGGDPTSTLLQNCASSSDKFYLLTSASQIISAFNEIGTNLTKLRVAK